jgi:hypothetical protein
MYLSNLYPWSRDSARMVFVDVARQPTMAAQKPNMLKLSSVIEVRSIPPTIGTSEAHMRTNHCRITASPGDQAYQKRAAPEHWQKEHGLTPVPVVAGVNDLMVCMKETGM